jgi:hypothetical protein
MLMLFPPVAEEASGADGGEVSKQRNPLAISPSLLESLRKSLKINKVMTRHGLIFLYCYTWNTDVEEVLCGRNVWLRRAEVLHLDLKSARGSFTDYLSRKTPPFRPETE